MSQETPIEKPQLLRLPLILVLLHAVFIVGAGYFWHGSKAGPVAKTATQLAHWVDFPVHRLAERLIQSLLHSDSPMISAFLQRVGIDTLTEATTFLLWSFLLVLGSMQWFLVGLGITLVRRLKHRYLTAS